VEKAIRVTYSECVSVALVIQHGKRMRHIVSCELSGSNSFPHYHIDGTIFRGKNCYWT